jgi:arylsulfatase A-like enzyme
MNRFAPFVALALFAGFAQVAVAAGKAKHVVIVVMDGLRPDSVVEADMPNLVKMAGGGVFFERHHPVYLSTTEVNGAALATGSRPGRSGIQGNREYRPDVDLLYPVDTQGEWATWRGDQITGGKWLRVETLPEIVRASGGRTAVAGTKGVVRLWDRKLENRSSDQPTLIGGDTIPAAAKDDLVQKLGPIPLPKNTRYFANGPQDEWTTKALTERLWANGLPALSVMWLSEPDYSQHGAGPGSDVARAALKSSDACLGRLLAALEAMKLREQTDVLVVSDHGFSTVADGVDVTSDLLRHDIDVDTAFLKEPAKGQLLMVGLGGSVAFYAIGHDKDVIAKLVRHLQGTVYAGTIFTKDGADGTFKLADAGLDSPDAADVVMSMKWSGETIRRAGAMPGALLIEGRGGYTTGQGMHGSLSRFDMNNTLIAAGPDFKAGLRSKTPSGNADVAPTVLSILGIAEPRAGMDGRVLAEALVDSKEGPQVVTRLMEATRDEGGRTWRQYLKVSRVGKQVYLDEGNSGSGPEK